MVYERFLGEEADDFSGWRCVTCGEIVDETMWLAISITSSMGLVRLFFNRIFGSILNFKGCRYLSESKRLKLTEKVSQKGTGQWACRDEE